MFKAADIELPGKTILEAVEDEDLEKGEIGQLQFRRPAAVNSVVHMEASPLAVPGTSESPMTFGDKGDVVAGKLGVTKMANLYVSTKLKVFFIWQVSYKWKFNFPL